MTQLKIAITGRFRRGKDTVADLITKELGAENVTRLAFADALKDHLAAMVWEHLQQPSNDDHPVAGLNLPEFEVWMREHRDLNGVGWQWLGEFMRQVLDEDFWIKRPRMRAAYEQADKAGKHIIITDMRYHNECAWAHDHGFYTVRVTGPNHAPGDVRDTDHPSEKHIDELTVHSVLWNTSTLTWLESLVLKRVMPAAADHAEALAASMRVAVPAATT